MAESRHKIKTIGAPFETQYSSCSNLKPKNFDWTLDNSNIVVHIDRGMFLVPQASTLKQNTFGWICESRFIVPDVYNFLIHKHKILFENYYNKIFTCDQDLINLNSNFIYCPNGSNYPWIKKDLWSVYNKHKLCSMFCSPKKVTEGHAYRHMIARLALDKGFDVFGGAHGTERTVIDPLNPWNSKFVGLTSYMFNIVIENGVYDSYCTEKLTDCFATGTIPIYWGSQKLSNIFDPDGIIWLQVGNEKEIFESLTPELYASKEKAIKNNFKALQQLKTADDTLFELIMVEQQNA